MESVLAYLAMRVLNNRSDVLADYGIKDSTSAITGLASAISSGGKAVDVLKKTSMYNHFFGGK